VAMLVSLSHCSVICSGLPRDLHSFPTRRSSDLLSVVTPTRRTSSGRRGSAIATRFWTRTCALSRSVPSRNVMVSVIWPSVVLCRSEEHTSELQSRSDLVCRLLLEKKKKRNRHRQ